MIKATESALLKLQTTLTDFCWQKGFGFGKTNTQILRWCHDHCFGFSLTVSFDHAGNLIPVLEPEWQPETAETIVLGGMYIFIDPTTADKLKKGKWLLHESEGTFYLQRNQRNMLVEAAR
jgi:hypothetical protein